MNTTTTTTTITVFTTIIIRCIESDDTRTDETHNGADDFILWNVFESEKIRRRVYVCTCSTFMFVIWS